MNIPLISREEAHAQGLKRFFTGTTCKFGHTAQRYVSTGNCVTCHAQRSQKFASKSMTGGFWYPLALKHHARVLAICQALDLEDGRAPFVPVTTPAHMDEAQARARIKSLHDDLGARTKEKDL